MAKIQGMKGVHIGHASHPTQNTGVTVFLFENGAIAGVDIRGSAPGTRETEILKPGFLIQKIHALVFTGGSAYGLRTADGVMDYLRTQRIGYNAGGVLVPIVPAAVIFDLVGERTPDVPSREMGYEAAQAATDTFEEGLVGAGKGATVGKIIGFQYSMPGGFGSAFIEIPDGIIIQAFAVVNALGDVYDPKTGKIIAGARNPEGEGFLNAVQFIRENKIASPIRSASNTTLVAVLTNAGFNKEMINKVAKMAQNGIARSIRPCHTMYDGDMVFAISAGEKEADVNIVGEIAAEAVSQAIVKAIKVSNGLKD